MSNEDICKVGIAVCNVLMLGSGIFLVLIGIASVAKQFNRLFGEFAGLVKRWWLW